MHKVILTFHSDTEAEAGKIRGLMHMHTKHVKIVKEKRATGVYGVIDIWVVMGGFNLKENAEVAKKEIDERFVNNIIRKPLNRLGRTA